MAADVASPPGADFFLKGESARNTRGLLRLIILCTIAAAAVASRLFSVIRFESIIHECMSIERCILLLHANACDDRESEHVLIKPLNSRPLVQLPSHQVPCPAWLCQLLGLVR